MPETTGRGDGFSHGMWSGASFSWQVPRSGVRLHHRNRGSLLSLHDLPALDVGAISLQVPQPYSSEPLLLSYPTPRPPLATQVKPLPYITWPTTSHRCCENPCPPPCPQADVLVQDLCSLQLPVCSLPSSTQALHLLFAA